MVPMYEVNDINEIGTTDFSLAVELTLPKGAYSGILLDSGWRNETMLTKIG